MHSVWCYIFLFTISHRSRCCIFTCTRHSTQLGFSIAQCNVSSFSLNTIFLMHNIMSLAKVWTPFFFDKLLVQLWLVLVLRLNDVYTFGHRKWWFSATVCSPVALVQTTMLILFILRTVACSYLPSFLVTVSLVSLPLISEGPSSSLSQLNVLWCLDTLCLEDLHYTNTACDRAKAYTHLHTHAPTHASTDAKNTHSISI